MGVKGIEVRFGVVERSLCEIWVLEWGLGGICGNFMGLRRNYKLEWDQGEISDPSPPPSDDSRHHDPPDRLCQLRSSD